MPTRKLTANQAFIVLLCANFAALALLGGHGYYLQNVRPVLPDPVHGFVVRQTIAHSHRVYYISAHDRTLDYIFLAVDLIVFWISSYVSYRYAKAAQRQKQEGLLPS